MTQKNTTVRYSLSALRKKIARGASRTRAGAPEGAAVGEDFWKRARVRHTTRQNIGASSHWQRRIRLVQTTRRGASYPDECCITLLRRRAQAL